MFRPETQEHEYSHGEIPLESRDPQKREHTYTLDLNSDAVRNISRIIGYSIPPVFGAGLGLGMGSLVGLGRGRPFAGAARGAVRGTTTGLGFTLAALLANMLDARNPWLRLGMLAGGSGLGYLGGGALLGDWGKEKQERKRDEDEGDHEEKQASVKVACYLLSCADNLRA